MCALLVPACAPPPATGGLPAPDAESFVRFGVFRGPTRLFDLRTADYRIRITDPSGTRVLRDADFNFPEPYSRQLPVATNGILQVVVTIQVDSPRVRAEGTMQFTLHPERFIWVLVRIEPPADQGFVPPFMRADGRAAFPIVGDTLVGDSLAMWWSDRRITRPSSPPN